MSSIINETLKFRKGDKYHLDDIYTYQGLGSGDWWEPIDEDGEEILITKNIDIIIQIRIYD